MKEIGLPGGSFPDEYFMRLALKEAEKAGRQGEVPVGAVVVYEQHVIGRGYNRVERRQDAGQHAEMIALRQAAKNRKQWRLEACDLYVTLEPCAMCAGAMVWSRIRRVIFGTRDPKAGACGSVLEVLGNRRLNHCPEITEGVLKNACSQLLKDFFKDLRKSKIRQAATPGQP